MTPSNRPSASEAEAGLQGPDVSLTTNNAGETGGLGVPPDLINGPTTVSDSPTQDQGDGNGKDPPRLWSDVARKPDKQDSDDSSLNLSNESSPKLSLLGIGGKSIPKDRLEIKWHKI